MASLFGLARLGKDAELRFIPSGDAVANLALAFSYGKKGDDGKRPTQWVDAAIFGKRAEAIAPFLLKGGLVSVIIEDVHIETYQSAKGEGAKLVGRIAQIDLAGGGQAQQAAPAAAPRQTPTPQPKPAPNFSDMDSDIPFALSLDGHSVESASSQLARSKQGRNLGADF